MARQTKEDKAHDEKTAAEDEAGSFITIGNTRSKSTGNEGGAFTLGKPTRSTPQSSRGLWLSLSFQPFILMCVGSQSEAIRQHSFSHFRNP